MFRVECEGCPVMPHAVLIAAHLTGGKAQQVVNIGVVGLAAEAIFQNGVGGGEIVILDRLIGFADCL